MDDAEALERLLPQVMRGLFHHATDDPLAELPVTQLRVLRLLSEASQTPSRLGQVLGMSPSATTQIINRLEASGWVVRIGDAHDRRVRHLELSESGAARMHARRARRVAAASGVLAHFPADERTQLLALLTKLKAVAAPPTESQPDKDYETA